MKNKRKRKREGRDFEVVPAGFSASQAGRAGQAGKAAASGTNTLRNAHSGAHGKPSSAKERKNQKAAEIWFRKCGHGEQLFASYYRGQGDVVPVGEWPAFEAALRRPLPVTFRLRASGETAALERRLRALGDGVVAPVRWAPASAGVWQAAPRLDKRALSKGGAGGDGLAAALTDGVASGLLNRQEAVSMLPVMGLRVQPGDSCLDMCASPGSKTMQLLEAVAASAGGGEGAPAAPGGIVVANDAHPKRVAALIEAIDRHCRPPSELSRLAVTCHRGEAFPRPARPFRKRGAGGGGDAGDSAASDGEVGFDRVLADVPCSGDGTIRKDPSVLPRWTPAVSNQLHGVQLEIAWRGLQLLRVGGLMAYSTCTFNPIEDEAVVASLLRRADACSPGAVRVEQWPADVLPGLRRRPGVRTWRVAEHVERSAADVDWSDGEDGEDGGGGDEVRLKWHRSFDEAAAAGMAHAIPTMWPPEAAEAKRMRLEWTSRMLPHDQDTGGFFIALLRKTAPLHAPSTAAAGPAAAGAAPAVGAGGTSAHAAAAAPVADTGPTACRQLPEVDPAELLGPLPTEEADELGGRLGMKRGAARRRLLQQPSAGKLGGSVRVAPAALSAFAPGSVRLLNAGIAAELLLEP